MGNNSGPNFDNHLVVKNATLKVKRVWDMTTITLIDCHIESPEGGKVIDKEMNGSMGQTIVDSDGEESVDIVIVPNSTDLREAYVVEDGSTLTFYYDANKKTRTGTVYGIYQKQASDKSIPAWAGTYNESKSSITSVVFDSSFKDYKPTSTRDWFNKCTNLKNIEGISNLNTENVNNMNGMFAYCESLTTLNVSNFNTGNVTDMNGMFFKCYALTSLDLTNFNTEKETDMSYMFQDCENLTTIYCDDTWTCSESSGMFSGCTKLKGAVAYDQSKTDVAMANPETGYFTKEVGTGIETPAADVPAARRGIYTLNGLRLNTSLDRLPAGIYIVDGRKVVKK
jgi:surface protein